MNTIYNLPINFNGAEIGFVEPSRKFKGKTEITYDFEEISSGSNSIIKIIIDFNDSTPLLTKDYSFTNKDKIKEIVKHTFIPSPQYQNIVYYPTIYVTFSNFSRFVYQTPIKIGKESFYSSYKRLNIASCQFLDNLDDSIFVTLDTSNGDILNLKLK